MTGLEEYHCCKTCSRRKLSPNSKIFEQWKSFLWHLKKNPKFKSVFYCFFTRMNDLRAI